MKKASVLSVTAGILAPLVVHADNCRVATTMCEVQKAIKAAQLAPTPGTPTGATVSVAVTNAATFVPNAAISATYYSFTFAPTVYAYITNSVAAAPTTISCTPSVTLYQYVGTSLPGSTSTAVSTYQASHALPTLAALTVTVCTTSTCTGTVDNTNFGTAIPAGGIWPTAQTGLSHVYDAYLTGTYQCTYTDPNTGGTVFVAAAIPQTT